MQMIRVEWIDSNMTSGWHASELQNYAPMHCTSVGFRVHEDEIVIVVAGSIAPEAGADVADVMVIPKCCVQQIRELHA